MDVATLPGQPMSSSGSSSHSPRTLPIVNLPQAIKSHPEPSKPLAPLPLLSLTSPHSPLLSAAARRAGAPLPSPLSVEPELIHARQLPMSTIASAAMMPLSSPSPYFPSFLAPPLTREPFSLPRFAARSSPEKLRSNTDEQLAAADLDIPEPRHSAS